MKKQIKLIALDLDGTLLNSRGQISQENRTAIRRASDAGIQFTISTGRPYCGLPLTEMKELGIRYAITANGAALYQAPDKTCIYENCMPCETVAGLVDELLPLGLHMDLFIQGDAYTPQACRELVPKMGSLPASLKEYILSTRTAIPDMSAYLREQKQDVQKITMNFLHLADGSFHNREKAVECLSRHPEICFLSGGFGNLEFTHQGITKAKGLGFLCRSLGITLEETLACGDSENDLAILEAAGIGIAMANAPEDIRRLADDVTLSNDENGVAAVIGKYLPAAS